MSSLTVLFGCIAALLGLIPVAIIFRGRSFASSLTYGIGFVACFTAFCFAGLYLLTENQTVLNLHLPLGLPWLGAYFRLDALSAFFLIVVDLGGAIASLYALGYGQHETSPERVLPFYVAFLAAMNLVVLADDAFTFLLNWEFMSLSSWALVMAHHRQEGNAKAGYVYLLMASFGTMLLLLAFGLMAGPEGGFTFDIMRTHVYSPAVSGVVLALVLVGAGSKAGLVPLHVWLPLAHPAAPSHVSALMSGVMTKVAIFGVIRVVFDLLGTPTWWWGALVIALGGVTAVIGVLYALMQHDIKKLLAYHTVENIGIIFIGLGLALAFASEGLGVLAALSLTAALFHVLNHSFFKSLLFFGAGAVLNATGKKDMEQFGGLIHRMPLTAFAFLIGSMAISAIPPFNGFVSEWLTFQAILASPVMGQWGLRLLVPVAGLALALSAALAAACFVKAFGITFLGRARSEAASKAREVDKFSIVSMLGLSLLCLLAGIFPGFIIDLIAPIGNLLVGSSMPLQASQEWMSIVPIGQSLSSYNGLLVFVFIVISATLSAFIIHRLASKRVRRSVAWDCGFPDADPATQYTATSFVQPIRRVFASALFHVREEAWMPAPASTMPARYKLTLQDQIWGLLYAPIGRLVSAVSLSLNRLQSLTIRRYLTLVLVVLVLMLMVVVIWR